MKAVVISTSPRENSNSVRVAKAISAQLENQTIENKLIDFTGYDFPFVGQGSLSPDTLTEFQTELIESWQNSDMVILTVPEYNWITSGQLINAIHQLASPKFKHLFEQKVFALAGVSSGRGGRLPCIEMQTLINKVISFTNCYSIVSPRIFESHETDKNLNENGESAGNAIYDKTLKDFVDYSTTIAEQWFR